MSWFTSFDQKSALQSLTNLSSKVQSSVLSTTQSISENISSIVQERRLVDEEERNKDLLRNYLSGLLPWETRDETRDILVEECRLAIMELSSNYETFLVPFQPPSHVHLFPSDEEFVITEENVAEAERKLESIMPLPRLLDDFDLNLHVGLIEKLFEVDEQLVKMHSLLTGAGEKEIVFWKNYFFHCAYVRYHKGLKINEIWTDKSETDIIQELTSSNNTRSNNSIHENETNLSNIHTPKNLKTADDEGSIELTFDFETPSSNKSVSTHSSTTPISVPTMPNDANSTTNSAPSSVRLLSSTSKPADNSSQGSGTSYEVLSMPKTCDDDTLEAEILQELEGL